MGVYLLEYLKKKKNGKKGKFNVIKRLQMLFFSSHSFC